MNPIRWLLKKSEELAERRGGKPSGVESRPQQFAELRLPPVPVWKPVYPYSIDTVATRIRTYSNGSRDFAVFRNGTVSILPDGLSDPEAESHAISALRGVFHAHIDMNPVPMKDGNIVVHYNHDVATVVLKELVEEHWAEIQGRHLDALATDEVLMTSKGPNVFDDHGKAALFGRCYMFMDAQDPKVVRIERKTT